MRLSRHSCLLALFTWHNKTSNDRQPQRPCIAAVDKMRWRREIPPSSRRRPRIMDPSESGRLRLALMICRVPAASSNSRSSQTVVHFKHGRRWLCGCYLAACVTLPAFESHCSSDFSARARARLCAIKLSSPNRTL